MALPRRATGFRRGLERHLKAIQHRRAGLGWGGEEYGPVLSTHSFSADFAQRLLLIVVCGTQDSRGLISKGGSNKFFAVVDRTATHDGYAIATDERHAKQQDIVAERSDELSWNRQSTMVLLSQLAADYGACPARTFATAYWAASASLDNKSHQDLRSRRLYRSSA